MDREAEKNLVRKNPLSPLEQYVYSVGGWFRYFRYFLRVFLRVFLGLSACFFDFMMDVIILPMFKTQPFFL